MEESLRYVIRKIVQKFIKRLFKKLQLYMTVDVSNMGSTGLSNFLVMGGPVGGAVPTLELFGSGVANLELTRKQGGVNLPMTLLLSVDFGRWTRLPTDERPCLEDEERSEMNSRLRRYLTKETNFRQCYNVLCF